MALSGKDGKWLNGIWDLKLTVSGWVVWLVNGQTRNSRSHTWEEVPDKIAGICVYHPKGKRTWMFGVDGYPDPNGVGEIKLGEQIGEQDCAEWFAYKNEMKRESDEWLPYII